MRNYKSCFLCASRRRQTSCAIVTGVQTCALPISSAQLQRLGSDRPVEAAPRLHRTLASHEGAAGNGLLDLVDRPHFSSRPFVGDLRPAEAWRTVITLPWPPAILSPTSRSQWARKLEPNQPIRPDCYQPHTGITPKARTLR